MGLALRPLAVVRAQTAAGAYPNLAAAAARRMSRPLCTQRILASHTVPVPQLQRPRSSALWWLYVPGKSLHHAALMFVGASNSQCRPLPTPPTQHFALFPPPNARNTYAERLQFQLIQRLMRHMHNQSTCHCNIIGMCAMHRVTRRQVHGPLRRLLRPAVPRQDVRRHQLRDSISQARNACLWRSMCAARSANQL